MDKHHTNKSYSSSALQLHAWVASSTSSPTGLARSVPHGWRDGPGGGTTGGRDQRRHREVFMNEIQQNKVVDQKQQEDEGGGENGLEQGGR